MLKSISDIRLENVELLMRETNRDRKDFSSAFNMTYNMFSQYFTKSNSRKTIGDSVARRIEKAYKKPDFWLDNEHTDSLVNHDESLKENAFIQNDFDIIDEQKEFDIHNGDEFEAPYFEDIVFSGGNGYINFDNYNDKKIKYSKFLAKRAGATIGKIICTLFKGDSMEELIRDGSIISIDTSKNKVIEGKIYAFQHGELSRVKYLIPRPDGGLIIRSHNSKYKDEIIPPEETNDIKIIGWVWNWSTTERWRW